MHGTALAWAQWRTRSGRSCGWPGALENGLAGDWTTRRRTIRDRLIGTRRCRRRRFVDRTRPGLRHDHARSLWPRRRDRRGGTGCGNLRRARRRRVRLRRRRDRSLRRRRWGSRWSGSDCRRRRRRRHGWLRRRRRRDYSRWRCAGRRCRSWRLGNGCGRSGRLCFRRGTHWRRGRSHWTRRCRRGGRGRLLLLPNDRLQHVSRFGNVRKIDLGLDLVAAAVPGARCWLRRRVTLACPAEMGANFLRFVLFQRAGMSLLLGDADFGQHIENCLAFHFQFSGQIIDSNLTHPPLCSSELSR